MSFRYAVALTGGIGSGKSTTSSLLRLYGYNVICADEISHQMLEKCKEEIIISFGKGVLENSEVSRKRLGKIVFKDKEKRKTLEDILHPKIKEEITRQARELDKQEIPYFIDIPLFFETKNYPIKEVLLIFVPKEIQLQRLIKRNHLTTQEANERISLQIPMEEKKKKANYIIDNSKDLENLQREVEKYLQNYLSKLDF
ncbi:dephospho-CoA kinase [Helicobacter pullorum]|uniref:dephospho-CoA kinase n=1 Tax=Helicobacter pullorum TaxID=35818 RepID=UPI00174DC666|nr:dephospho-CoA kinase [Helicobacter pullorum]